MRVGKKLHVSEMTHFKDRFYCRLTVITNAREGIRIQNKCVINHLYLNRISHVADILMI